MGSKIKKKNLLNFLKNKKFNRKFNVLTPKQNQIVIISDLIRNCIASVWIYMKYIEDSESNPIVYPNSHSFHMHQFTTKK